MMTASHPGARAARSRTRVSRVQRMRAGWRTMLLAALLAFSWQSFLIQTHRHYDRASVSSASASRQSNRQLPADTPANCPICSEIAHAGPVMLPTPIEIIAPAPATFHAADTRPLGLSLVQRSHAWRSRAPPHHLQG